MYWKTFTVLVVAAAMTASCTDYQDEIDALDGRVSYLESLVVRVNADILTLQDVVDAMDQGDYITGVKETPEGYVISFNNAPPIFVHHGTDGKDAQVPAINIAKDPNDGNYYWTLDGQWITDPTTGERVRSNGKDGVTARHPRCVSMMSACGRFLPMVVAPGHPLPPVFTAKTVRMPMV